MRNIMEDSKLGAFRLRTKQLEELGVEVCEVNYRRYESLRMSTKAYYLENVIKRTIKQNGTEL